MKKLLTLSTAALLAAGAMATQYCGTTLTSVDGSATIQLSCEQVGTNYKITVAGENLQGFGGSFFHPGATDLRTTIVTSTSTEIVCMINTAEAPSLYTPLYVLMPGEKVFNWPGDVEWGSCGSSSDTEAPVMVSASLVSNTHNSALISVAATDNEGVAYYKVIDAANGYQATPTASEGQISVKNLKPATSYNLTISAVDNAGNESANSQVVSFTTDSFSFCEVPYGHMGDANFADADGRILLTLLKVSETTLRVVVRPNYENGATKKLDYLYVAPAAMAAQSTGADTDNGGVDEMQLDVVYDAMPATINLHIEWSHPAWPGRWACDVNGVTAEELCEDTPATTLENVANSTIKKTLKNGVLVIEANGVRYNALGAVID